MIVNLNRYAGIGPAIISPIDFILKHGQELRERRPVKRLGPAQECYRNAYMLALRSKGRLRYVEGYAAASIPVGHAWCVDADGFVIDPTWDSLPERPEIKPDYFGVIFREISLVTRLRKLAHSQSIFEAWSAWETLLPELEKAFHADEGRG